MGRSLSESELLASFRKIDRADVQLPAELCFPLEFDDMFTWAIGPRAYMVLANSEDRPPLGIVFHRDGSGPLVPAMCDWCHTTRGRGEVTLVSCAASRRRWVGLYLCRDLSCGKTTEDYPRPENFYERRSDAERMQRIVERARVFATRHLF